ncbi:MAG: hypothetical protein LUO96_02565 [Methanomicrobiales archaeon]|nr:hypothetical protein [Methanomicrobiales archaeon]
MGWEFLQSQKLNRLIFVLYVLVILVITVSTPTQKLTGSSGALVPAIAEPAAEPVESGALELQAPEAVNTTGTPEPTPVPAALALPAEPAPEPTLVVAARATLPPDLNPPGFRFEYKDNNRKQIVSTGVRHFAVSPEYSYFYEDLDSPDVITVRAREGYKFILVGVTWDLVGIVGEGSRTTFVTPAVASYTLVHEGQIFKPLDPHSIDNPLHLYIRNHGSLAVDKAIDKDNPGSGILIFEVPEDLCVKDAYIEFCPKNGAGGGGKPRSPDNWDCKKKTVRWMLAP